MAAALILGGLPVTAAPGPSAIPERGAAERPNIVLILVDDAALMDFGAYGGEARTPNIDRLAARGALLTRYRTSPLCSPSRAMLLTGVDSHRTGVSTIEEVLPPEFKGRPGYTLHLEPGVLTVADRLGAAGYRTLMAGKWHLGRGVGDLPNRHGFQRSLALDASGADNWAPKPYMPYYDKAPWYEDGAIARLPDHFYSSDLLVDRLIDYIDEGRTDQPYFAYLAFQAVHIPVQAPRVYSDHYKGVFNAGWEALREARWRRAQAHGLIPQGAGYTPLPDTLRSWSSLTDEQRAISARGMEVYSGMIEAMDASVGRLVAHIAARGELDRTVFVVTSDNGPEPSDPVHAAGMNVWMTLNGYHWDLETLGERGSLGFIGPEWAASVSSPSSLYKFYASEGGLRVPFVVSGPGVTPGRRVDSNAFVADVTPTLLDLAGADPTTQKGRVPVVGRSLVPVLAGTATTTYGPDEATGVEVSGNAALFRGTLKIVRNMPPVGDGRWHLFDLSVDPGETTDLSSQRPEDMVSMLQAYGAYARRSGVLALPDDYEVESQIAVNTMKRVYRHYGWQMALLAAGTILTILLLVRAILRRRARG